MIVRNKKGKLKIQFALFVFWRFHGELNPGYRRERP